MGSLQREAGKVPTKAGGAEGSAGAAAGSAPECAGQWDSWVSRGHDGNWGAGGELLGCAWDKSCEQDGPPSSLGAEMALGAGSHLAWCREECWDHTFPDGIWSLGLLETDSQVPQESEEGVLGSLRLPMAPHSARWMPEYSSQ